MQRLIFDNTKVNENLLKIEVKKITDIKVEIILYNYDIKNVQNILQKFILKLNNWINDNKHYNEFKNFSTFSDIFNATYFMINYYEFYNDLLLELQNIKLVKIFNEIINLKFIFEELIYSSKNISQSVNFIVDLINNNIKVCYNINNSFYGSDLRYRILNYILNTGIIELFDLFVYFDIDILSINALRFITKQSFYTDITYIIERYLQYTNCIEHCLLTSDRLLFDAIQKMENTTYVFNNLIDISIYNNYLILKT